MFIFLIIVSLNLFFTLATYVASFVNWLLRLLPFSCRGIAFTLIYKNILYLKYQPSVVSAADVFSYFQPFQHVENFLYLT